MSYDLYLEIGPLQEIHYTGISNVTLALCQYGCGRNERRAGFS